MGHPEVLLESFFSKEKQYIKKQIFVYFSLQKNKNKKQIPSLVE